MSAPRQIRFVETEPPEPTPGEVSVRLAGCGVCASNVPLWEGREWFDYPQEPGRPGHEGWGEVAAAGEGVGGELAPGTPVALVSERAFAEHDLAPAGAVVPLPPELAGRPFPGEPLACVMNVFRRSGVTGTVPEEEAAASGDAEAGAPQTVAVVGAGFLGALLVGLARQAGARVAAVSRRTLSLETAERYGAELVLPIDDRRAVVERIAAWTDGRMCDRVIECTGRGEPLDLAGRLCGVRRRLVVAGFHQDGLREVDLQLWNWRGLDVVNAHERNPAVYARGLREAVEAVVSGRLDPYPLLTHGFPLRDLGAALEAARRRPDGFMKAWVET